MIGKWLNYDAVSFMQFDHVDVFCYVNRVEQPVILIFKPELTVIKLTIDEAIVLLQKAIDAKH